MNMKAKKKHAGRRSQYFSRLTSKFQATVPKEIRNHLHVESGDEIVYELLADNTVVLRKKVPLDLDYLQALDSIMNEWESEDDERAYKNL